MVTGLRLGDGLGLGLLGVGLGASDALGDGSRDSGVRPRLGVGGDEGRGLPSAETTGYQVGARHGNRDSYRNCSDHAMSPRNSHPATLPHTGRNW
jgi:hypothetical protein